MNLDEADPTLRIVYAELTFGGLPLEQPHTFADGDVKLYFPDGTSANAANLPTLVTATADATIYKLQIARAEAQQRGDTLIVIASATIDTWPLVVNFDYPALFANDARLNDLDAAISTRATPADVAGGGDSAQAIASAVIALVRTPIQQLGVTGYSVAVGDLEPPMPMQAIFGGRHVDLTGASAVNMIWTKPDKTTSTVAVSIVDAPTGMVQRVWASGDTDQVGQHSGQLIATWPGTPARHETFQTLYTWQVRDSL